MLRCLEQSVCTTVACRQESGPDQRVATHAHMGFRVGRDTNLLCGKYYADNDITNAIGGFTIYVPSCPTFVLILHLIMGIQNVKFVVCLKFDR